MLGHKGMFIMLCLKMVKAVVRAFIDFVAISFCFSECVFLLLEKNAPIKVKNEAGWSPLAEAISWGSRSIGMKLLLHLVVNTCTSTRLPVDNQYHIADRQYHIADNQYHIANNQCHIADNQYYIVDNYHHVADNQYYI